MTSDEPVAEAAIATRTHLEAALGVRFHDAALLERALAHRSWCAEHGDVPSNERLEFLGDSILGVVVTTHVFHSLPEHPEGQLSEVRAAVVNGAVLAQVAAELGLGDHLLLGKGEDAAGGRAKRAILADALEAVIAAVYLDQGFDAAEALVLRVLGARIAEAASGPGGRDYKTRLQELAANRQIGRPRYHVQDDGPDHAKTFHATVLLDGVPFGAGEGRSKKEAEQAAAWQAFDELVARTPLGAARGNGTAGDAAAGAAAVGGAAVDDESLVAGDGGDVSGGGSYAGAA